MHACTSSWGAMCVKIPDIPQAEFNEPIILLLATNTKRLETKMFQYSLTPYKITIFQSPAPSFKLNLYEKVNFIVKQTYIKRYEFETQK